MSLPRSCAGLTLFASTCLFGACSADGAPVDGQPAPTVPSADAGAAGDAAGGGPRFEGGTDAGAEGGEPAPPYSPPDFGPNVLVFDPSMSTATIQGRIDAVYHAQAANQFGAERYTYLFKPGRYDLDVQVGYYMQVLGLGQSPDDVTITGAVRSKADWNGGNATENFWRSAENLSVVPTQDSQVNVWAVSQGTDLRRIHVKGSLALSDGGWSSGGFIADSMIDSHVSSGSQQQFLTRNTVWNDWQGGSWNMVFVGDTQTPAGSWPSSPYTVVDRTPIVREKPYLALDVDDHYVVVAPGLATDSQGTSWGKGAAAGASVPIGKFFIAHAGKDTATTINAALTQGKNLIFTPGVYHLDGPIRVSQPGTIVLGLGLATLVPDNATAAMVISDVDAVSVGGLLFEAGVLESPALLVVGEATSGASHAKNPTVLWDTFCRIGGANVGTAASCMTIDSHDVIVDNVWLWRADHGAGADWNTNRSKNGLVVNGDRVTAYGLFVEHFQEYQTAWNGNGGRVYFYQSELPYDPPSQAAWQHGGVNGYASYKVADGVTAHEAWGLGVYCVFYQPVVADNAIETPVNGGVSLHHMITLWLGVDANSAIRHIVNGTGASATQASRAARTDN